MATEVKHRELRSRTRVQNGTDFQEVLKMESSRQKETGKDKNDPEKNL